MLIKDICRKWKETAKNIQNWPVFCQIPHSFTKLEFQSNFYLVGWRHASVDKGLAMHPELMPSSHLPTWKAWCFVTSALGRQRRILGAPSSQLAQPIWTAQSRQETLAQKKEWGEAPEEIVEIDLWPTHTHKEGEGLFLKDRLYSVSICFQWSKLGGQFVMV